MIRVLIADDHPIVRQGLKQVLADTRDIVVGGEAVNGAQVLQQVRAEKWDVLVLDLNMPEPSGLDLIKSLVSEFPRLPILILSVYPEEQFAVRVLKAGAAGYLVKDSAPEVLVTAIRKVYAGGKYISSATAEAMAMELQGRQGKSPADLSDREFQVLRMMASGKTASLIAAEMGLSVKTISTYRARLLEKHNLKNNAEHVRYALEKNLTN
jgi:two-component system invasion response regulator UvrY